MLSYILLDIRIIRIRNFTQNRRFKFWSKVISCELTLL